MPPLTNLGSTPLQARATPIAGLGATAIKQDHGAEALQAALGLAQTVGQQVVVEKRAEASAEAKQKAKVAERYSKRMAQTRAQNIQSGIRQEIDEDENLRLMEPEQFQVYVDQRIEEGIADLDPELRELTADTVVSSYRNGLLNHHRSQFDGQIKALNKEVASNTIIGNYEAGMDFTGWSTSAQVLLDDGDTREFAHNSIMEAARLAAANGDIEFLDQLKEHQKQFRESRGFGSFIPQDSLDEFAKLHDSARNVEDAIDIQENLETLYEFEQSLGAGTLTFQQVAESTTLTDTQKRSYVTKVAAMQEKARLKSEETKDFAALVADPDLFNQQPASMQAEVNEAAANGFGIDDYSNMEPEAEAKLLNYISRRGASGIPKGFLNYVNTPAVSDPDLLQRQVEAFRKVRGVSGTGDLIPGLSSEATAVFALADAADNLGITLDEVSQGIRDSEAIRDLGRAKREFKSTDAYKLVQETLIEDGGFLFYDGPADNFGSIADDVAYIGAMMQSSRVPMSDEAMSQVLIQKVRSSHSQVDGFNGGQDILLPRTESGAAITDPEVVTGGFNAIFDGLIREDAERLGVSTDPEDYTLTIVNSEDGRRLLTIQSLETGLLAPFQFPVEDLERAHLINTQRLNAEASLPTVGAGPTASSTGAFQLRHTERKRRQRDIDVQLSAKVEALIKD